MTVISLASGWWSSFCTYIHASYLQAGLCLQMRGGFLCIMHVMAWTWNASVSPHLDEPGAAEAVLSSADG
jgi:hypothetical protein